VIAEHSRAGIRIAAVCPLVHEGSHSCYVHTWLPWRADQSCAQLS
jgi:hypothetical protein